MKGKNRKGQGPGADAERPGNVVDLARKGKKSWKRDRRYREALAALSEELTAMADGFLDRAFQLALAGPWREWDESAPEGTELYVDDGLLRESGDPNVARLLDIQEHLYRAAEELAGPKRRAARDTRDEEDRLLDELIEEENKTLTKEQSDSIQDYADFMMGEGKYRD